MMKVNLTYQKEPEILVTYEAWIESVNQLFSNERVTDEELLEDDKEDGMWQVEIMAHLIADNGTYFAREELLFKLHNLMANKELGDHVFLKVLNTKVMNVKVMGLQITKLVYLYSYCLWQLTVRYC